MRRSQGAALARAVLCGVLVFAGVGLGIRCLGDDAATSMAATAIAQANVRSFRVRTTITTETTTRSQTTEFVAPDRIHITSEKEETISVPEGTFTRRQGGPWKASPANISLVLKQKCLLRLQHGNHHCRSEEVIWNFVIGGKIDCFTL